MNSRDAFESLPVIQEIMNDDISVLFDVRFNKYLSGNGGNEEYLNGAWMTWQEQQKRIDELELKINNALEAMDGESANSWGLWKEKADMYEQGASNAYERSYWILKGGEQ